MRIGADTGGTFTDVVSGDGRSAKTLSTPSDPAEAVRDGVAVLAGGAAVDLLAHGTTVATNALLERRGARVALYTTQGFSDVIEIARQDRPSLYDPWADRPVPLVAREDRLEVGGRLDAAGAIVEDLDVASVPRPPEGVEAAAVCLLHSDIDPVHEALVCDHLQAQGIDVTASFQVSPEFREYERTVTTVLDAYLRPVCRSYLAALDGLATVVLVMTSAGGLVPILTAAERPASLLLSGPAGGVRAAAACADANGFPDAITFDMGGTSTDVCLVLDGHPEPAGERHVGGFPVRLPALDVHTIGAGGGSIARIDQGGALVVGPRSAGAAPGPACYGRGGVEATVTDANLVAGRIDPTATFPGLGPLDVDAARLALERGGVTAEGVLAVVNANMEKALRAVSVDRGVDPRELALVAFGGAGPLHACDLARSLGMSTVIVPPRAGVLSAVGLLCSPVQRDLVQSWPTPRDHTGLRATRADLARQVLELTGDRRDDAVVTTALDCRYRGQSHELTVDDLGDFHQEHRRRNGYDRPSDAVEVIAVRARARLPAPLAIADLGTVPRPGAVGPQVIAEHDCTIWVPDGWEAEPGELGALLIRLERKGAGRS